MHEMKQLKYWQIFLQTSTVVALPYAIYQGWWEWLLWGLAAYCFCGLVGTTVGYHRLVAHKSFETYTPVYYFIIACGMVCSVSSPLTNALIHRSHHKYTDSKRDPHSPHLYGIKYAFFGDWMDKREVRPDFRLIREEMNDPFMRFTHKYYTPLLMCVPLLLLLIDWKAAVYLYIVPAGLMYYNKGYLNTVGHMWGTRRFDTPDKSRNSWAMNIASLGDGWHNNHHADPSNWNTSKVWWELDPAAWFIWLVKKPDPIRSHKTDDLMDQLKTATKQ